MADFAANPLNYGALLGGGQGLVADPLAAQGQMIQNQNARIAGQQAQQQMAFQRYALQRQQAFGQEMGAFVRNPTAAGLAGLFGKYPEFDKQAAEARAALNTGDVTQLGSAAALAAKGQYGEAAKIVQQRIDAEKAAGGDSSQAQEVADLLNSGDPAKQKAALGMLSLGVGIAVGPDKAAEFLNANGLSGEPVKMGPGDVLKNPTTGDTTASVPLAHTPITLNTHSGGQSLYSYDPNSGTVGGGSPGAATSAGGGGPASAGGAQSAIGTVLHNEGGYNPKDLNGSPTNYGINYKANAAVLGQMGITPANFKDMTQAQAEQIYATKYWPQSGAENLPANMQTPYFDVYVRNPALAKSAWKQSGGDPQKFMSIVTSYFNKLASKNPAAAKYANAWTTRDANNLAIATQTAGQSAGQTQGPAPLASTAAPTSLNTKEAEPGMAWNAAHTAEVPVPGGQLDPNTYGGEAEIRSIALNHLQTGKWGAGGGMGGGNIPPQVQQLALAMEPKLLAEAGIKPEQLPGLRSRYTSDAASLTANTGMLNGLNASEQSLHTLFNQVQSTQKSLVDMGILGGNRHFNEARLAYYKSFGTQAQQAAINSYEKAVNGAQVEYSKFMSTQTGMGNAPTTDASRARATALVDETDPQTSMNAGLKQLAIEAAAKKSGVAAQNNVLMQRMQSYFAPHAQAPANTGATQVHSLAEYNDLPHGAKYIDPHGTLRTKK